MKKTVEIQFKLIIIEDYTNRTSRELAPNHSRFDHHEIFNFSNCPGIGFEIPNSSRSIGLDKKLVEEIMKTIPRQKEPLEIDVWYKMTITKDGFLTRRITITKVK